MGVSLALTGETRYNRRMETYEVERTIHPIDCINRRCIFLGYIGSNSRKEMFCCVSIFEHRINVERFWQIHNGEHGYHGFGGVPLSGMREPVETLCVVHTTRVDEGE